MHPTVPGTVKLYSADPDWVEAPGSYFKDQRNHPTFYIQSFIENVFPGIGAKRWESFMLLHTALQRTYFEPGFAEDVRDDDVFDNTPHLHYVLPVFAEALLLVSEIEDIDDTVDNRVALARLLFALQNPTRNHAESAARSVRSLYFEILQAKMYLPIRNAYPLRQASSVKPAFAEQHPQAVIRGKIRARKQIREGIAESQHVANTLLSHQEELARIVEVLFHKMRKVVTELRYRHVDTTIERSNDPRYFDTGNRKVSRQRLQGWPLQQAAHFYDTLQEMRSECVDLQTDCNNAIHGVFLALELV